MYKYNLAFRFQHIAEKFADRTAIWFSEEETIDYARLNSDANRLARLMLSQGISLGDVVCL